MTKNSQSFGGGAILLHPMKALITPSHGTQIRESHFTGHCEKMRGLLAANGLKKKGFRDKSIGFFWEFGKRNASRGDYKV